MASSLFDTITKWEDVESLITGQVRESEILEYKEAISRFVSKDLAKDVSAFANSNGGVIVFGIKTHDSDTTLPERITGILDSNIESFEQHVNSNIQKNVKGIRKHIITNTNGTLKVMVVDVPQSEEAPHQSLVDKKYYVRRLAQSEPMEHYLIELMFGRRFGPVLDLRLEMVDPPNSLTLTFGDDGFSAPLKLRLAITNSGKRVARDVLGFFFFPSSDKVRITGGDGLANIDELHEARGVQARQYNSDRGIFHPGTSIKLVDLNVAFSKAWAQAGINSEPILSWQLFADEMNPRNGTKLLKVFGNVVGGQTNGQEAGPTSSAPAPAPTAPSTTRPEA